MEAFFTSDEYHTDENTPRAFLDKLMLNSRFFFMKKYFSVVLRSRRLALKGQFNRDIWAETSLDIFKLIENCGGRFHITGLKNLYQAPSPVVFVSNHMSTLETMVFPGIIAPVMKVTFVVKDSLVRHPFFGPVMRSRYPIVVKRSNSREDFKIVMNQGGEFLSRGISVVLFPQGTRNTVFDPREFNSLGVKLAGKAKVKVVPIAVKTDFWENGKYMKDLGPIRRNKPIYMAFGEPMEIKSNGKEENNNIIEFISTHLTKWGA